jgi:Fur family zinc uptake transcriptional regulator
MSRRRTPDELDKIVMSTVADASKPITAYGLVAILSDLREQVAPQQVYRTLERLVAKGDVVRIETLNAYRATVCEGEARGPLLFCRECRGTTRARCPGLEFELVSLAERIGFQPARFIVEISGLCAVCQAAASGNGGSRNARRTRRSVVLAPRSACPP